ncbi:MAG: sulfatase [Planctomycetes bacterium]|nr:sulfatase [Planctomycetota bacterium]
MIRLHVFVAVMILVLSGNALAQAADHEAAKGPNVVVLMIDQLRADVLGCYGGGENVSTPHMDRLAERGVVFTNGLSTYPLCSPYRAMLMTGRYPCRSGMIMNFLEIDPDQRCIAHVFKDAGYHTGFIGKWHLAAGSHREVDLQHGSWADARPYMKANPNFNFVPPGSSRLGFTFWAAYNFHSMFIDAPYYRDKPVELTMPRYETDSEIDLTIECIEESRRAERPFFVVVAPHPPHPPFDRLPDGYLEQVAAIDALQWNENVPEEMRRGRNARDARGYLAMVKNADDNVGRLLDYLDREGLAEDTIVVLTADHGEMLGSHGRRNKMVPYAEAVRIPVIMSWPGHLPTGRRTDALHTPIDHLPTLCALAGLEPPETADGLNLTPAATGRGEVERDEVLMMTISSHWDFLQTGTNWPEWRGLKTRRYTYVRWLDGKEELYDDIADPAQRHDRVDLEEERTRVSAFRARLTALLDEAGDPFLPGNEYAAWYEGRAFVRERR